MSIKSNAGYINRRGGSNRCLSERKRADKWDAACRLSYDISYIVLSALVFVFPHSAVCHERSIEPWRTTTKKSQSSFPVRMKMALHPICSCAIPQCITGAAAGASSWMFVLGLFHFFNGGVASKRDGVDGGNVEEHGGNDIKAPGLYLDENGALCARLRVRGLLCLHVSASRDISSHFLNNKPSGVERAQTSSPQLDIKSLLFTFSRVLINNRDERERARERERASPHGLRAWLPSCVTF